ncbi:hypothetical protein BaRGS_00006799, partial [Batillaria attramentaria]
SHSAQRGETYENNATPRTLRKLHVQPGMSRVTMYHNQVNRCSTLAPRYDGSGRLHNTSGEPGARDAMSGEFWFAHKLTALTQPWICG